MIDRDKPLPKLSWAKDAVCPKCGKHNIISYTFFHRYYGCLDCGWRELDD